MIRFSAAESADFTRRTDPKTGRPSGERYDQVEAEINRLARTATVTDIVAADCRRTNLFGMIDNADIERREKLITFGGGPLVARRTPRRLPETRQTPAEAVLERGEAISEGNGMAVAYTAAVL